MTMVPLAQDRQQLSGLLDRIQAGEYVVISRHGKPVARLIPEPSGQAGAELWLERLECDGVRGGARWPGRATFARRLFGGALCGGLF
jgi:prevent-host-death family protein